MNGIWTEFSVRNSASGDSSSWGRVVYQEGAAAQAGSAPVTSATFTALAPTASLGAVSGSAGVASGTFSALAPAASLGTVTGNAGVADAAFTSLAGTASIGALSATPDVTSGTFSALAGTASVGAVSGSAPVTSSTFTALAPVSGAVVGVASATFVVLTPSASVGAVSATSGVASATFGIYLSRGVDSEDLVTGPKPVVTRPVPVPTPEQVLFPFEIPLMAQRSIELDPRLGGWNKQLVDWWDGVRKRLRSNLGSASAVVDVDNRVDALVDELARVKASVPSIITVKFSATNSWVYRHNRGVRPIVKCFVYTPQFGEIVLEGNQYEDTSLNTTTVEWDANYEGYATYAFPVKP